MAAICCAAAGGMLLGSLAPVSPAPISNPFDDTLVNAATNASRYAAGNNVECATAWLCSVVASWFCKMAPMTALPIAAPSWRIVLRTAEAAPATRGSMLRIAIVVMGAKVIPMPAPAMIAGTRKLIHVESGPAMYAMRPIPIVNSEMPAMRMYLPPMRSDRRPANGAVNIEVSDIGAKVNPATRAENPRTDCR